jgi:hypothetical protein
MKDVVMHTCRLTRGIADQPFWAGGSDIDFNGGGTELGCGGQREKTNK